MCLSHFLRIIVFWPYYSSYSEHFSFSSFVSVSCHIPDQRVFVSLFPRISVVRFFPRVSVSLRYSSFYNVYFSFYKFFGVFCHITRHGVFVSLFPVFQCFGILQVLQCTFLFFLVSQCFSPYSRSKSVFVLFSTFFSLLLYSRS